MNWLLDTPIAHRGLFDNVKIPENSLTSFQAAVDSGFPIELDVRILSDGHLVVFHDHALARMTGLKGSILKMTLKELKTVKLLDTDQGIPLLSDVLKLVNGKVPLLLEIKTRKNIGWLELKLLNMLSKYKGEYAIESFNPWSIKWFRDNAPEITRGQLSSGFGTRRLAIKNTLLRATFLSRLSKPDFIAFDVRYLPCRSIKNLKEKGYPIIGYTARSREEFDRAMQYCNNIIFEGFIP
ncbi:MAG: glycerophosphodiester phosphodiesterase family protein [Bacteroidota bacterium]|nr:glycerophosphodiester phosphodiesterase family protein [Bacteroidota bacterium]